MSAMGGKQTLTLTCDKASFGGRNQAATHAMKRMSSHDRVVVSFGALLAVLLTVVIGSALTPKPASHPVVATVVAVYVSGARFPHTGIVARAPHAIEAQAFFQEDDPELCKVGDQVDAMQTGISIKVNPYSCRRPTPRNTDATAN